MAQERPATPERQLLNLIENKKAEEKGSSGLDIQTQVAKRNKRNLFSFVAWISKLSFSKDRFKRWFKELKPYGIHIKVLNNVLIVSICIITFYFISNLIISMMNLEDIPEITIDKTTEGSKPLGSTAASIVKRPVSYYLEKTEDRDIFKMGFKKKEIDKEKETVATATSRIIEATRHLRLVGISWSSDPEAMIEDTKSIKTFFVKRGQMIGKVKVEAIFQDKIILGYEGEEIELK